MTTIERIKEQLEQMPPEMLIEIEHIIARFKKRNQAERISSPLFDDLITMSESDDLPKDLSINHDHYIYRVPKK